MKDLDGRYVIVNQAAARFAGRPAADMVGRNDLELYPEETARRFMADEVSRPTASIFCERNKLAFSRRRQLNPQPVGINALVENMIRLLGRALGATVRITRSPVRFWP